MDVEHEGKIYKFPGKYRGAGKIGGRCSDLHKKVRLLLRSLFPSLIIMEEVSLPGINLTADFYIHSKRLMVEVNGEQHYRFIPFFHGTKIRFLEGQRNDREKEGWCEENGIKFVGLPFDETEKEWGERLKK